VCWQLAGEDEDAVLDEVTQLGVDCGRELSADLLRHQLAVLILRLAQVPPVVPAPGWDGPEAQTYLRFRREVEAAFGECRRVEVYAERLGCSVRTLTRACLAVTGRTAKQVIVDRVVLEARRMLAGTALPVAAIAQQLGFDEPTHFGRLFHRATGLPPGTFRAGARVPAHRHHHDRG
jgi:AraC-like DNA-binding protein